MSTKLFQPTSPREHELYARIRDHGREALDRQRLEQWWLEYREYAPKSFPKKLQIEFHQRWWEMYLTIGLHRLGLPVSTPSQDKGPDVLLTFGSSRVWIEAVAPTPGMTSDAVPLPVIDGVQTLPMRECLLRLSQVVKAKRIAFDRYIQQGIVSKEDCRIIAVSACNLNQFGSLLEFPQPVMLRVLEGAGDLIISQNGIEPAYSNRKNSTFRDSGSPVDLALFCSGEFSSVAGVLYSKQDLSNAPTAPEESFELFLNPKSKVAVPVAVTEKMVTWSKSRDLGPGVEWKRTQPADPPSKSAERRSDQ